jgi:squalene synthase HpnC
VGVLEPPHASHGVVDRDDPLAKAPGENFPVALRVLPPRVREDLQALYRFARHVDDIGDEPLDQPIDQPLDKRDGHGGPGTPHIPGSRPAPGSTPTHNGPAGIERRLQALDQVAADVRAVYDGSRPPADPIVAALASPIARRRLPADPFLRLIEANRQDQVVSRYQTFDSLVGYCTLSANPVGELVLHIFGRATPERVELSDRICTALQLVEHWQDVAEDYARGRVYLPQEDLRSFGVAESDLAKAAATAELQNLIAFETERAQAWLDSGAPLIAALTGRARLAVSGYVAGGRAACTALRQSGYDPLSQIPKPTTRHVAAAWLRSLVRGWA